MKKNNKKLQKEIYSDFQNLFKSENKNKSQKKFEEKLSKDFEKIFSDDLKRERKQVNVLRKKKSSKGQFKESRFKKEKVELKRIQLKYTSFQKTILLNTPLKMTQKRIDEMVFYLQENFLEKLVDIVYNKKFFKKNKYTLITIGYHFFFYRKGKEKNYQSGFRTPRIDVEYNKAEITDEILELFNQVKVRHNVYFETRNRSSLFFEGLTIEISHE